MKCSHCGKSFNKVIDSRSTQRGIAIRRRRECLVCSGRFSTYECAEEQLLRVLIWKDARPGSAVNNLKAVGESLRGALKSLTEETEKLIVEVDKMEKAKAKAVKKSKRRPPVKLRAKKKARVKKPPARKARRLTDTAQVLKIIKRHKRGIDLKKLRHRTGFQDNKIRDIVFRARKTGKIKRVNRGVYIGA